MVGETKGVLTMIDEQTRRSVETMCLCGLDLDGLKGCFPKIEESVLREICESVRSRSTDSDDNPEIKLSCNCS